MNMQATIEEPEGRAAIGSSALLAGPSRPNPRKQFAAYLRGLSVEALRERHQQTKHNYESARRRGDCSLEAVLYFDLAQVSDEVMRRSAADDQALRPAR